MLVSLGVENVQQLRAMILPVWNFEILQELNLNVQVAQPSSFFSQFREGLQQFPFVSRIWRKFFKKCLHAAAVGSKPMHLARFWLLAECSHVPPNTIKYQPRMSLIINEQSIILDYLWTHRTGILRIVQNAMSSNQVEL